MAPHLAPIFIKLLSRLQIPPSTRSLIANEAAMESSALALSGLRFEFHEARDAEEKMRFSAASSRGRQHLTLFCTSGRNRRGRRLRMGRILSRSWQMRAPWKALDLLFRQTSPALRSHDDMVARIAVDLGAMMHHHHHHRLHILTVETMLLSN